MVNGVGGGDGRGEEKGEKRRGVGRTIIFIQLFKCSDIMLNGDFRDRFSFRLKYILV